MPGILELLRPDHVLLHQPLGSKKRVLEVLSAALAAGGAGEARALLELLGARERLGSTALGGGLAIPHCRVPGGARSAAALLTLRDGVEFGADDERAVDVFVALAVPEDASEAHLGYMAELARLLDAPDTVRQLRGARDPAALLRALAPN